MSLRSFNLLTEAVRPAAGVWLALMCLLAATCVAAYADLGPWRLAAGLGIALLKAALVGWFFMKLKHARLLLRAVLTLALATLALLFGLSATDLLVRPEATAPLQAPRQLSPLLTQPLQVHVP